MDEISLSSARLKLDTMNPLPQQPYREKQAQPMPNLDLRTKSAPKRRSLARARKIAGYSQESLAERLGVDRSTVARWEAGEYEPQPWQRPRIAEALGVSLCEVNQLLDEVEPQGRAAGRSASLVGASGVLGTEGHELVALLNGMTASRFPLLGERCIKGHKFIPVFVGADVTSALTASGQWDHVDDQWMECWRRAVEHPAGVCQLYVWPFGVVVFHLAEDLMLDSVAHLAVWRRISYEQNMKWAHDYLQELTGVRLAGRSYVLSLYWMNEPAWQGNDLCTALRLMCIPRVLVSRAGNVDESCLASAVLAERALIGNGFDHPEIVDFGMKGISLGYASWSGVVYHPIARARALHEDELIACELSVQAAWVYCDHLRQQVESGDDPAVPAEFGWRFLRGVRSRLTTERPQETSQHRCMRNAIVRTSGLDGHLVHAVEILRDCGRI